MKIKLKKVRNKKGFSLVELLAVVVILGLIAALGISATSYLSDLAKKNKMESQKNTVTMSAETYLQNNKNLVPKIIGDSSIIKVSDLRRTNYLTEDIKNNKGESCMEKSYVRVYKLSNTEYTYTTFLYCGEEEVPADEVVPSPIVTAKFSDSSGAIKDDLLNNVSDAYLYIEINAATEGEIASYKSQGTQIAIDGYTFKIFVYKGSTKTEAYNSGSLSGGREEKIVINKKLQDYIDVTDVTEVSIEVIAINTLGGSTTISTTIGVHNPESDKTTYDDNVKPKCVKPDSPYTEGDWLNKNEYNATKDQRKLTVGCDDGTGSGCIRNYFTKSWPNDDDKKGAEFVIIEVKDNAGNVSEHNDACKFRVNVDIQTPEATVTAYAGLESSSNSSTSLASKINGSNLLKQTIKVNDSNTSIKIEPTDSYYSNLVGNNTDDKWMNNQFYPYGVIYKVELKDNIRLDKWTWNTNAGYINSEKASNYLKVSSNNPEATNGVVPQDSAHGKTEFHGSTKDTIYVRFLTEGMRYGVLTVYDKAGNKVEIKIAAHLDRTAPPIPNDLIAYVYNKVRTGGTSPSSTRYTFSTWTNKYVRVETASGQNRDNLTEGVTLSGFWQFYYDAKNNAGNSVGTSPYNVYSSGIGYYDFKGSASQVDGKNNIKFKGCDKAGNCSLYGTDRGVWIDITIPECTVKKAITSGAESSYGWLGIGESARVTAYCNDPTTTLASGCTVGNFYHDYNYQINITNAGAKGRGEGGSFTDYAGNSVTCSADKRIQIDYVNPTCSVSGGSNAWTNSSRTVTGSCSDTGGAGCVSNISHTYNYDIETSSGGAAGRGNGGYVYDKADNSVACLANQTVKVDRTNPYVTVDVAPGTYNSNDDIVVTATCNDALSGLSSTYVRSFTATMYAPTTGMYIGKCCQDNAGNTMCDSKGPYKIKIYGRHPDCGVESYKTCEAAGCGVKSYKSCYHKNCGSYSCSCRTVCTAYDCEWCRVGRCGLQTQSSCSGIPGLISSKCSSSTQKCSTCNKYCENYACGVKSYNVCPDPACGVKLYKQCWHYGANVGGSSGGVGGGGTNTMMSR